jgi:uracil-DNA glycosylase
MSETPPEAGPADPVSSLQSVTRALRLRLEDEARAGRMAVPRSQASAVSGLKEDWARPAAPAAGSKTNAPAEAPAHEPAAGAAGHPQPSSISASRAPAVVRTPELFGLADGGAEDINREETLARIAAEVAACDRCPELVRGRNRTVPGQGNPYAQLVFIGEGPGEEEDRQGLAFVGRAGELLTKMIEAIGMTRQQVFIANIVKCRPPGNRTPLPDESANCAPYLMRQLEILRPKVICALGGTAAKWLLQTHDGITRLRGRFYPYHGVQLMPTFHPAYVLRNYTPDTRKKVYEDLLKVKAELTK